MAEIKKIESLEEFNSFVSEKGTLNVLKVSTDWCGPCRALSQVIHGLSQEDVTGVLLGEVNADDEWFDDIVADLGIRGVPVMIAYKGGVEVDRVVGLVQRDALKEFFEKNK